MLMALGYPWYVRSPRFCPRPTSSSFALQKLTTFSGCRLRYATPVSLLRLSCRFSNWGSASAAGTTNTMASCVQIKDYRGLTHLTPEQEQQLAAWRAAAAAQQHKNVTAAAQQLQMPTAKLNSGHEIPLVGLGTWKAGPGQVREAVLAAVRCGYRHIDCASIYGNEHEVGAALSQLFAEGTVKREELFITTKLWNSDHVAVEAACKRSLAALKLDYLDLFLIHWPVVSGCQGPELNPSSATTWAAMEQLVQKGLVRSIGMSNFSRKKLEALLAGGVNIKPAVLQAEAHPYWPNSSLVKWAQSMGMHVTAYSPLGSPDSAGIMRRSADGRKLIEDPTVVALAQKYGKLPAQVLIRWALERGCSVLPKSINPKRIAANLAIADWQMDTEDVQTLSNMPYKRRMVDGNMFIDANGPYKTLQDLWDDAV